MCLNKRIHLEVLLPHGAQNVALALSFRHFTMTTLLASE